MKKKKKKKKKLPHSETHRLNQMPYLYITRFLVV